MHGRGGSGCSPGAAVVAGIPAAVPISAVVAAPISVAVGIRWGERILAEALRILRHTQRRIFQDGLAEA